MAAPRLQKSLSTLKNRHKARGFVDRTGEKRRLQLESLEDRRLLALGPSLVSVIPNSGVYLNINPGANDVLNIAPRDITFRFAQGNSIDASSLGASPTFQGGIRIVRGGADHVIGTADDQIVAPGFLGLGDTSREVVMRFASNLPDDAYRVTLVGTGLTPLKDSTGSPFNGGVDQAINFTLDLGTKISAIVPQPIIRGANNVLTQNNKTIEVYFDQTQQLLATDAIKPSFYDLIDAATGAITLPQSVTYDSGAVSKQAKATLTFAAAIPAGTFKLEIGATTEPDDRITTSQHVGNSMTTPIQALIGDNLSPGAV